MRTYESLQSRFGKGTPNLLLFCPNLSDITVKGHCDNATMRLIDVLGVRVRRLELGCPSFHTPFALEGGIGPCASNLIYLCVDYVFVDDLVDYIHSFVLDHMPVLQTLDVVGTSEYTLYHLLLQSPALLSCRFRSAHFTHSAHGEWDHSFVRHNPRLQRLSFDAPIPSKTGFAGCIKYVTSFLDALLKLVSIKEVEIVFGLDTKHEWWSIPLPDKTALCSGQIRPRIRSYLTKFPELEGRLLQFRVRKIAVILKEKTPKIVLTSDSMGIKAHKPLSTKN